MDQTTAFDPNLYVRLLDGTLVAFARSSIDHWADLAERMAAERRDAMLADIDAQAGLKPLERVSARTQARDAAVSIHKAIDRCRNEPRWIKAHLIAALVEAGHSPEAAAATLALVPAITQASIADQIAMLPVVANARLGSKQNPLVAGVDFSGAANASTGATSSASRGDATPGSPSAGSRTARSTSSRRKSTPR